MYVIFRAYFTKYQHFQYKDHILIRQSNATHALHNYIVRRILIADANFELLLLQLKIANFKQ